MRNTIKWTDDPVDQICCMWAQRHGQPGTVREVAERIVENSQGQAAGRIAELEAEVARLRGILAAPQPGDPLPGGLVVAREKLTDAAKAKLGGWGPNLDDMWAAMIEASHD